MHKTNIPLVCIRGRDGKQQSISTVEAATFALLSHWPPRYLFSGSYIDALSAAVAARSGRLSADQFREVFVSAAREAGILLD